MNPQRLIEIPCSKCGGTIGYMLQENNFSIHPIKCRWCVEIEIAILHYLNYSWAEKLWEQLRYSGNMRTTCHGKAFRDWFIKLLTEMKYG